MIEPFPSASSAHPVSAGALADYFERLGVPADAASAAQVREQFAAWLGRFFDVDAVKSSDMVLATNEALANAAEFAYVHTERPGTMDVCAHYVADDTSLTVIVTDRGNWRMADPRPATRTRGRGIPLMHALTDRASVETSAHGTTAYLRWTGIRRGGPGAAPGPAGENTSP
ncbi:ATP-binding protein [Mycolicibacterium thermoresistibile]